MIRPVLTELALFLLPFVVYAVAILLAFQGVLMIVAYTVLAERKVLGWMQGRIGPNRVGPWGVLQPFADLLKFIFKEDLVPDKSTKFVYFLAPLIALTCALMPIVVYPFGPRLSDPLGWLVPYVANWPTIGPAINWVALQALNMPLTVAHIDVGVLFVLGITSVGVLAAWVERQPGVRRVTADALVGNEPSRRVLARLGFTAVGEHPPYITYARDAPHVDGPPVHVEPVPDDPGSP